jgi:hypothetical protein
MLLIITDGITIASEETKRKLSLYCELPFSVIFVGVGRADFTAMYDLLGFHSCRKNTTFIELRKHQQDHTSLAKAALQHIPGQVVEYMVENGITLV